MLKFLWNIEGSHHTKSIDRLGGGVGGQPELSSFLRSVECRRCLWRKKVLKFPVGGGWGGGHLLIGQCHHKRRNNYLKTQLNDL